MSIPAFIAQNVDMDERKQMEPLEITTDDQNVPQIQPYGLGWRHVITLLSFCGFFCIYTLRVNLSVALVAMVNHTAVDALQKNQSQSVGHSENIKCYDHLQYNNTTNNQQTNKREGKFVWNEELQGIILGAFFYGYITTQIPGGFFASKLGGKWIYGLGTFWTAILTLLTPLAAEASPYWLIAVRALEGVGEGMTWPAMQAMFSRWAPPMERSKLPALAYSGCYIGTVVAFISSGYLSASGFMGGWPAVFYVYGLLGCVWFVFWALFASSTPENHPYISAEERNYIIVSQRVEEGKRVHTSFCGMPWKRMATSMPVWALIFSHFTHNWGFYTLLTQLPAYLKNVLGFDIKKNGVISSLPYLCMGITQAVTGFTADKIRTKLGLRTVVVRKACDCFGHLIPGVCLVLVSLFVGCDSVSAVVLLTFAVGSSGLTGAGCFVNHLDIAPKYSGFLFGISNSVATIPGIAGPYIVGLITKGNQTPAAWSICFYIASILYGMSVIFYAIFAAGDVQAWARGDFGTEEHTRPMYEAKQRQPPNTP